MEFSQKEKVLNLEPRMRRRVTPTPGNTAEGCRRKCYREYLQFQQVARESCSGLETTISLSHDLEMINQEAYSIPFQVRG